MYIKINRFTLWVLVTVLVGCGASEGGGGNPVPVGSSVVINPPSIAWDITAPPPPPESCFPDDPALVTYNDHTLAISVVNSNNVPLGDVEIRVVASLAGNTYAGIEVLKIYDDRDGDHVVDDPDELVSSNTSPAFVTRTARHTGEKYILLRVNLNCTYRGNVYVYAGTAYGSAEIQVQEISASP